MKIILTERQLLRVIKNNINEQVTNQITCVLIQSKEIIKDKPINYVKVTYNGITKIYKLFVKALGEIRPANISHIKPADDDKKNKTFDVAAEVYLKWPLGWQGDSGLLTQDDLNRIKNNINTNNEIVLGKNQDKTLKPVG